MVTELIAFFISGKWCDLIFLIIPHMPNSGTSIAAVLVISTPRTALAILGSGSIGFLLCSFFSGFQTGLAEGVILIALFLYSNWKLTGDKFVVCVCLRRCRL
jgi:hypothetical protein